MTRRVLLCSLGLLWGASCDTVWQSYLVPCTPGQDCPSGDASSPRDLAGQSLPGDGSPGVDLPGRDYWVYSLAGVNNTRPLRGIGGAGGQIIAVGDSGTCLLSTDGKTWTAANTGNATDFSAVWASAADNAWLVGANGARIYLYNGFIFTAGAPAPGIAYTAVFGASATQVIAVGMDSNLGAQYDKMSKWQPQDHNYNARQRGMWGMAGGTRLWTVGEMATGGYFDLAMNKWSPRQPLLTSPNPVVFRAIWGTSDTDVWAVGGQGTIVHHTGVAFVRVPNSSSANLNGVWGLAANNIWAVGDSGTILHYDGTSWQPWTNKRDIGLDRLLAIWGDQKNLWTVSAEGNIYRYQ